MRLSMTKLLSLLVLIAIFAFGFGNSSRALDKIQESRVAETAREMVISQQWLLPHFNGELRLQKPPLSYWTTAASFQAFGVNEFALRLPSLLFGLATIALLFIWLAKRLDKETGLIAALVMVSSFIGMRYFRSAEADATLIFFITSSLIAFECMSQAQGTQQAKRWGRVMMLCMGLAFLSKGPAGLAIPLLTAILWGWRRRLFHAKTILLDGVAWSLFLVSGFAWYLWIMWSMPDIANQFFTKQLDETFVSGTHIQPWYWYLLHAVEFFSPWGILLFPAAWFFWRQRPEHALIRLAAIWLMVVLVLLSITVNKQIQYALLLLPPISILLAYYFVHAGEFLQRAHRFLGIVLLMAVTGLVINIIWKHQPNLSLLVLGVFFALPFCAMRWQAQSMRNYLLLNVALIWALSASTIYLLAEQYFLKTEDKQDIKVLAQQSKQLRPMFQFKPGNGAISFYAGDIIKEISPAQLDTLITPGKPLWMLTKNSAQFPGVKSSVELHSGSWAVWRLEK